MTASPPKEAEALAALTLVPLFGTAKIRALCTFFGSAQAALDAPLDQVEKLPGFSKKMAQNLDKALGSGLIEKELSRISQSGVKLLAYTDPAFPQNLLKLSDPPVLLYLRGELQKQDQQSIAIVGTRNATVYGMEMAERLAYQLAASGVTVVSGLARGIDTAAHLGALRSGRTLAFIGSGLDNIYPTENKGLAITIPQNGAVLSEYPLLAPPNKFHFPQRNRLVSGMTQATLLIEAPLKSGAMITMEQAFLSGKKTFVLPGRADLENFQGNHHLIREGKAQLIENVDHLLPFFSKKAKSEENLVQDASQRVILTADEQVFFDALPQEEASIEEIHRRIKLPIAKMNVLLMSLVMKKVVKEFPGKIYKRAQRS